MVLLNLFIIGLLLKICRAHLNEREQKITLSLMNKLQISHCLLVTKEEENYGLVNLLSFKNFASSNKAIAYQNVNYLIEFLQNEFYPDQKTIIVLKVEEILTVVEIFKKISELKIDHKIYVFTWLNFVNWSKSSRKDELKLLVPLNCQFFINRYSADTVYKLVELYKVQDLTFVSDFAYWSSNRSDQLDGLVTTNLTWYQRRLDLKNLTLPLLEMKELDTAKLDEECRQSQMVCAYFDFLKWLSSSMNFSFNHYKVPSGEFWYHLKNEAIWDYPLNLQFSGTEDAYKTQISGPVLKQNLNWFIKKPGRYKRNDYYILPFDDNIWISIFMTIILGSITIVLIHYFFQTYIVKNKVFISISTIFLPLDCFTNQNGVVDSPASCLRIFIYSIRFAALFVIGTYSATVTSFMAVEILRVPFKNLQEFLNNGDYVFDMYKYHTTDRQFFEESHDPALTEVRAKYYRVYDIPTEKFMQRVCLGKNIQVAYTSTVDIEGFSVPCEIHIIDPPLRTSWSVMVIAKRSPFKKIFNYRLIQFYSSGIRQRITAKFLNSKYRADRWLVFDSMEYAQISQIVMILLYGVIIAAVIFICEFGFKWIRARELVKLFQNNALWAKAR